MKLFYLGAKLTVGTVGAHGERREERNWIIVRHVVDYHPFNLVRVGSRARGSVVFLRQVFLTFEFVS